MTIKKVDGIYVGEEGKPMYQILGMKDNSEYKRFHDRTERQKMKFNALNLKVGDLISHFYTDKDHRIQYIGKITKVEPDGVRYIPEYKIERGKKSTDDVAKREFFDWYWHFFDKKYVPLGSYGTGKTFLIKRGNLDKLASVKKGQKRLKEAYA